MARLSVTQCSILCGEPELSATAIRDIDVMVEDTYLRYVGKPGYDQAVASLVDLNDIDPYNVEVATDEGQLVSYQGESFVALVSGVKGTPLTNPKSWKRRLFIQNQTGDLHQNAWDNSIGYIASLRLLRSSLPDLRAPIRGGSMLRDIDKSDISRDAFRSKLANVDERIALYTARLERFAIANSLRDWLIHPDKSGCSNTGRNRNNPLPFVMS